jgi:hypothetical protein
MKKFRSNFYNSDQIYFEIEQDIVGFYLRLFDINGTNIADYLQDSLNNAKAQAKEEYGVPYDAWYEISSL